MTKMNLIRGTILSMAAVALSGCYAGYQAPPAAPAYGYDYPAYGGYYYGPSASFGFYGDWDHHDWDHHEEDDWHHGDEE
jgi:hypothetical protein